jgi:uncharacterized protein YjbI with pentapeptide repeats
MPSVRERTRVRFLEQGRGRMGSSAQRSAWMAAGLLSVASLLSVPTSLTLAAGADPQTITFNRVPNGAQYGESWSLDATSTSGLPVTYATSGSCTVTDGILTLTGLGTCTVTASQAGDATHAPAPDVPLSFAVGATPIGVSGLNGTMTYGAGSLPALGPSVVGLVLGDTPADLSVAPSCSTPITTASRPGHWVYPPVTCTGGSDPRYRVAWHGTNPLTNADGMLRLAPAFFVVTAPSAAIVSGDPIPALVPSYNGFVNGDTLDDHPLTSTCTTTATSDSAPGVYPIACSGAWSSDGRPDYDLVFVNGTLTVVGPGGLDGASQSIDFGPLPNVTYGQGPVSLTATATSGLPVTFGAMGACEVTGSTLTVTGAGACAVTASQAGDATYAPAPDAVNSFVVARASLSVTTPTITVPYGAPIPTFEPTYGGFVNGDGAGDLDVAASCARGGNPRLDNSNGPFPVTCDGAADPNYDFDYYGGGLVLSRVTVTVTAPTVTVAYGDPLPISVSTPPTSPSWLTIPPTYAGFVNGDTQNVLLFTSSCQTTATNASPPGVYPITCSTGVGFHYRFAIVNGTLTILPPPGNTPAGANVTVMPVAADGSSPASLTFSTVTAAGTSSVVTTTTEPALPSGYQLGSPPAYYDISTTAGYSGPTTVCLKYDPAGTPDASVLRLLHWNGQTWDDITTIVDEQADVVCGISASLSPFVLAAPKPGLTITASDQWKAYGTSLSLGTTAFTTSGLANGDTVTGVTLTSSGAAATALVGTYPIVPCAATGSRLATYTVTYASGTLHVVVPDRYVTRINTALTVAAPGVLGLTPGAVSAVTVSAKPKGTLTLQASGAFSYVPKSGFTGVDTFAYRATVNGVLQAPVTVTVYVFANGGQNATAWNLAGLDLRGQNLSGSALSSADLRGAILTGANLSGSNLAKAKLDGAVLNRANLSGVGMSSVRAVGASLDGANLTGSNLSSGVFDAANVNNATITGANLTKGSFAHASMSRANLNGSNLSNGNLAYADLSYSILTNTNRSGASFTGANLTGVVY